MVQENVQSSSLDRDIRATTTTLLLKLLTSTSRPLTLTVTLVSRSLRVERKELGLTRVLTRVVTSETMTSLNVIVVTAMT